MNRRDFIRDFGKLTVGAASIGFLIRCSNPLSSEKQERKKGFENYIPRVNDEPLPKSDYFVGEDVSDSSTGHVGFYDAINDQAQSFYLGEWSKGNVPVGGLEAKFYAEDIFGSRILHAVDPRKKYFPLAHSLSGLGRAAMPDFIEVFGLDEADYESLSGLLIQQVVGDVPSWDPSDVDDLPGYYYLGDWSVDDFQNLVDKAMLVLTILTGGGASSVASLVSSVSNSIDMTQMVSGIEFIHDFVDPNFFVFNQSQDYSVYLSVFDSDLVLFPSSMSSRSSEQDIKYLLPLKVGNSWRFTNGSVEEVVGTRDVNGKKLGVIRSVSGIEQYFGFYNDVLSFHGLNFPQVGNIFFDPGLPIGDSRVRIGREYKNDSEIIVEEHPHITGSGSFSWKYIDRENVLLSSGKPYGDCYKAQERVRITMRNNDTMEEISDDVIVDHWLAKNIGKVRMLFEGQTLELSDANIIPKTGGQIYPEYKGIHPYQTIEEMVKILI